MRGRRLGLALAVAAVGAAAAACSGGSSAGGSPPATLPATSTSAPVPTPDGSPTPSLTPSRRLSPTAVTQAPACTAGQLVLSLGSGQGTAGSIIQVLVFSNHGTQPCTLFGYPGVSFVDRHGNQVGKPASEDPGPRHVVTLASGGSAHADLREPDPGNFAGADCQRANGAELRVFPPNQRQALTIADQQTICTTVAGRTGILPVQAGSSDG